MHKAFHDKVARSLLANVVIAVAAVGAVRYGLPPMPAFRV